MLPGAALDGDSADVRDTIHHFNLLLKAALSVHRLSAAVYPRIQTIALAAPPVLGVHGCTKRLFLSLGGGGGQAASYAAARLAYQSPEGVRRNIIATRLRNTRSLNVIVGRDPVPRLAHLTPPLLGLDLGAINGSGLLYTPYHKTIYFPNATQTGRDFNRKELQEWNYHGHYATPTTSEDGGQRQVSPAQSHLLPPRFALEPPTRAVEIRQEYTMLTAHTSVDFFWMSTKFFVKGESRWPFEGILRTIQYAISGGTGGDHGWILYPEGKEGEDGQERVGGWAAWGVGLGN